MGYFLYARTGRITTLTVLLAVFLAIGVVEHCLFVVRWMQLPFFFPAVGNLILLGMLAAQLQGRGWSPMSDHMTIRKGSDYAAEAIAYASAAVSLIALGAMVYGYVVCATQFDGTQSLAEYIFHSVNATAVTLGSAAGWYRLPYFANNLLLSQACLDDAILSIAYMVSVLGMFAVDIAVIVIEHRIRAETIGVYMTLGAPKR